MSDRELTVKAITRLTGLNEHTLRAWERRYGAVRPHRLANGRRAYTEGDVERLRKMVQLVERGYAIGRISRMTDAELSSLLSRNMELAVESGAGADELGAAVEAAVLALARYDLAAIDAEIQRARFRYGAKAFALDLVSPLMARIGRLVVEGRLSIGQEHALSAMVRAQLVRELPAPRREPPALAIATMEGDQHELAILISAVLCTDHGLSACYLGPSMPPAALAEAVTALGADVVLVGMAPLPPGTAPRAPERYLELLAAGLPEECEIWVGGATELTVEGVRYVRSLDELDGMLAGLDPRVEPKAPLPI